MKRSLMNNWGLKILAFLFAFLLWLMVVNIDDPVENQTYNNIAVTVEHDAVVTNQGKTYQIVDDTQTVSVTVSAKRSVLNKIKAEDISATADMKELYLKSQVPITVKIPDYAGKYDSAFATPRNLQVKLEDNISNKFPITPVATGTVRDGYVLGEMSVEPEKVSVNGPKSVVSRINRVVAEVDVSGLAEDVGIESSLVFYDADNNVIDQALLGNNLGSFGVTVEVTLLHTKSVSIEFDESAISTKIGYSVAEITYEPKEISVAGSVEVLADISKISIPASALAGDDISEKTERVVDITEYLPEGVQLVDENAGSVIVTISVEKEGTKTFDIPVGSITVSNLSDTLKLSYGKTDDLELHIRGPQDVLDALQVEKKVSIDLKDFTAAGTYTVPVEIDLPAECQIEGTAKVEIVLEEK